MPHILIVEDETIIRSALRRLLERNQYEVSEAGSVQEAQERFSIPSFDLIVSDLRLPGAPGTELIKLGQGTPVLIMTSYASLRSAVDSMKMGAVDYIAKPFDHDEMLQAVARILRDHQQAKSAPAPATGTAKASADKVVDNSNGEIGIIGSCPAMQEMYSKIRKVAPTDSNVLIQGESGTGKELVARALHNLSRRAKAPLISVNCAAIPESLIESNCSAMRKAPLLAPAPVVRAWLKPPTVAPCSSMKSVNCPWKLKRVCCVCCRKVRFAGLARYSRRRSMCA